MKFMIMFSLTLIAYLLFFGGTSFISARNASADSEQPIEKQISQESMYTIQTGSFEDRQGAEKQFRIIEQSLEGTSRQALRIEMIGSLYAVRIGRFAGFAKAAQFLKEHEINLEGAMVMKAYFIAERIILLHDGVDKYARKGMAGIEMDRYFRDIPHAPVDLGLKLIGTALVDESELSIAIIENSASGNQETYKEGDTFKGIMVKRILSRGVIIDEGKGDKILIMAGGQIQGILSGVAWEKSE